MIIPVTLSLCCQLLLPIPSQVEAGGSIAIQARQRSGDALTDLSIEIEYPDGHSEAIGSTDADGRIEFRVAEAGNYLARAILPGSGILLMVPLYAVAPTRRWLYALWCMPLGLGALFWNLRAWNLRHLRRRPPSRPAP